MIRNPIIPGFNPDPSIVRVGEDYYIATSSFSYFPGMPIYHSRDLVNWELINYAIKRPEDLPLTPSHISGGLFAPTLRYHDGKFYLIVVNMSTFTTYVVTADDPAGEWSKPHHLPIMFDPDLFWDDDGKCYVTYAQMANTKIGEPHIFCRELDTEKWEMTGEEQGLWTGALYYATAPEAPHLYKINGWYYLLIAEGGTEHYHAATIARSRELFGPYEGYHGNPILTHRHLSNLHPICNVGHADLVETQNGEWYMVCLASRIYGGYHKNMGRETFIAPVIWEDEWPVVSPETGKVEFTYPAPNLPAHPFAEKPSRDDFDGDALALEWNFLGTPTENTCSLEGGKLCINAHGSIRPVPTDVKVDEAAKDADYTAVGFVGRRQQHINFDAMTRIEYEPSGNGFAGLAIIQNNFAGMSIEIALKDGKKVIRAVKNAARQVGSFPRMSTEVETTVLGEVEWSGDSAVLAIRAEGQSHSFRYGADESSLQPLFEGLHGGYIGSETSGGFVGAYIGMFCSECGNASFDWFEYEGR